LFILQQATIIIWVDKIKRKNLSESHKYGTSLCFVVMGCRSWLNVDLLDLFSLFEGMIERFE